MDRSALANRLRGLVGAGTLPDVVVGEILALADELDSGAAERYAVGARIAGGGMGDILVAEDRHLLRSVAMKVLRGQLLDSDEARSRFDHEAMVTAHLEHPAIIPVHDRGILPDGRPYFTMKDARLRSGEGRTFGSVIAAVHRASGDGEWRPTADGWTFHRLVGSFQRICEAVAYAHAEGVVHRDLKPDNVLVGSFGEVLVIDWGLAWTEGARWMRGEAPAEAAGRIRGTPAYMPPEQARGDIARFGPWVDVYSLGAMLYELLAGRPPYEARDPRIVLQQVLAGPPDPPGLALRASLPGTTLGWSFDSWGDPAESPERAPPPVPAELQDICMRAMAREVADRPQDAGDLAQELSAWLEGSIRRQRALEVVDQADKLHPGLHQLRMQARALDDQAGGLLEGIEPWRPVEDKAHAWALQDRAQKLWARAEVTEVRYTQLLQAALTYEPNLREAHERLADHYARLHRAAEVEGRQADAARFELLLRSHDTGRYAAYLEGSGAITLWTLPGPAIVTVQRYEEKERRILPGPERRLGTSPLERLPLERGSYRLRLEAPGRERVWLPIVVDRQQQVVVGEAQAGRRQPAVVLPPLGALSADECLVSAGPFQCGGDAKAPGSGPACQVWVDSFVMRADPVTNREYIAFLDDLVRTGREQQALALAPRERAGRADEQGPLVYGRDEAGRFVLVPDADGDIWELDWPVFMVDWYGAVAYADWLAERTGLPWRLPRELEWEKAARGVDGRLFPWGNHFDATWACLRESSSTRPLPTVVPGPESDVSPYGVRGMAGNVRDWCLDPWRPGGPDIVDGKPAPLADSGEALRVIRGGNWSGGINYARVASRDADPPASRTHFVGFRLVRSAGW